MPALVESNRLPDAAVRQQLDRVVNSQTFQQVDRLKRFLMFITVEALSGRSDQLKEYVIGVQVFGKEDSFDPRTDPIVRVQARRLRAQLARYYRDEQPDSDVLIELPKGGYVPVIRGEPEPSESAPDAVSARPARRWRRAAARGSRSGEARDRPCARPGQCRSRLSSRAAAGTGRV